jgi:LysM repeat protein
MLYLNRFVILSTGISLIALSACSPRGGTANITPTASTTDTTQSNFTPMGINSEPLYQGDVASQQLSATMSPVTSEPMGYTDNNIVTGSINPQASLNAPVTNNMYTNTANNMSQTQYTVQAGDTIYSIGRKFNVHPNQIIERNPIPNPNSLLVGQTFSIPVTSTYAAGVNQNVYQPVQKSVPEFPQNTNTPNMSQSYTVQSGDTLYSIGRKFNIHPSYIINKNPAINPNYLSPGQVLNIVSKQDTPQNISTQKTVSNNQNNIMGTASAENNMDKQILSNALSLPVQGSIKENKTFVAFLFLLLMVMLLRHLLQAK